MLKNFILEFILYKNKNLSNDEKDKLINNIIFHINTIPDYLSLSIKCSSILFLIFIKFFQIISFKIIKSDDIFLFIIKKKVSFFFKLFKFYNGIYELMISDKIIYFEKNNINYVNKNEDKIFDFIIVGSGPAGSIIASNLEKNKSFRIIESGNTNEQKYYSYNEIINSYKNAGVNITFGNSQISFVEANCVGGGSVINSGLFHKIPDILKKEWRIKYKLKIDDSNSEKIYDDIIKRLSIKKYLDSKHIPEVSKILEKGARSINFDCSEIPRWVEYDNIKNIYRKKNVKLAYLNQNIIKNNLIQNTEVLRIKKFNNIWNIYAKQNNNIKIYKSKNVILSAGAINTPKILLNSGIKKNVGKRLQMHPTIKVVALFDRDINFPDSGVATFQARSPKDKNIFFGSSISEKPYLKIALDHIPKSDILVNNQWKKMSIFYVAIKPEGTGKIHKLPFFQDPMITYNLTHNDKVKLAKGLKDLSIMLLNAGSIKIFPSIINSNIIYSKDDLKTLPKVINPKKSNLFTVHLFSSCPIGENKELCAANSQGKVFGYDNLYVCDSSMLPSATGVNPQGSTMYLTYNFINNLLKK